MGLRDWREFGGLPAVFARSSERSGGGHRLSFFFGAGSIQFEEAGEDILAGVIDPAVTPWLLAVSLAIGILLVFVVEDEFEPGLEVAPSIRVEYGPVHDGVQVPKLQDVWGVFVRAVKAVVGFGQALALGNHLGCAELVIVFACDSEAFHVLATPWKGECLKAIGRRIVGCFASGPAEEICPDLMHPALHHAESRPAVVRKDLEFLAKHKCRI